MWCGFCYKTGPSAVDPKVRGCGRGKAATCAGGGRNDVGASECRMFRRKAMVGRGKHDPRGGADDAIRWWEEMR